MAVKDGSELVLSWQRESWWLYSGVLSSALDRERYWEAVSHALNKYFNEDPMVRTCIYTFNMASRLLMP